VLPFAGWPDDFTYPEQKEENRKGKKRQRERATEAGGTQKSPPKPFLATSQSLTVLVFVSPPSPSPFMRGWTAINSKSSSHLLLTAQVTVFSPSFHLPHLFLRLTHSCEMADSTAQEWRADSPLHWAAENGELKSLLEAIKAADHLNPIDNKVSFGSVVVVQPYPFTGGMTRHVIDVKHSLRGENLSITVSNKVTSMPLEC